MEGALEGLDHLHNLGVIEESVLVVRDDHELVAADALFAEGGQVVLTVSGLLLLDLHLLRGLEHVRDARKAEGGAAAGHDLRQPVL